MRVVLRSTAASALLLCAILLSTSIIYQVEARKPFSMRSTSSIFDFSSLTRRNETPFRVDATMGGGIVANHQKECRKVNKHKHEDKCAFIHKNCDDAQVGLINYLDFYYCHFPKTKVIPFIVLALWLGTLFTTIGIAASDFFCVNLSTISSILGMSESMAGVTFLAFGNGSPDVFSTFAAMKVNSGSLAVGELIGAASFITAVVAGSMAIVRPFKVAKKSFVRDVIFFSISVCFGIFFLWDGKIKLWECVVMISFYIFYVIFVVLWHWYQKKLKKRRRVDFVSRGHYTDLGEEDQVDEEDEDGGMGAGQPPRLVLNTDFDALETNGDEYHDNMSDDEEEEERDQFTELNRDMQRLGRPSIARMTTPATPSIRPSLVGAFEFRALLQSFEKERNFTSARPIHLRSYSDDPNFQPTSNSAPGTLNVPVGTDQLLSPVEQGQANRKARHSVGPGLGLAPPRAKGRLRAVSVNDVLLSHQSTAPTFGARHASPIPEETDSQREQVVIAPPLIEFSGPSTPRPDRLLDPFSDYSLTTPSSTFLAPPSPSGKTSPGSLSPISPTAGSPLLRPILTDSSPSSSRASSIHRYLESPRPMSSSSMQMPSITLPGERLDSARNSSVYGDVSSQLPLRWWPYAILPSPEIIFSTLFPTLWCFRDKSIVQMFLGVVAAPAVFLLTITLPVVESPQPEQAAIAGLEAGKSPSAQVGAGMDGTRNGSLAPAVDLTSPTSQVITEDGAIDTHSAWEVDEKPREWNRWLVGLQCVTAPVFIVLVILGGEIPLLKPILYALLGGMITLLCLMIFTSPDKPPKYRYYLCFAGFVVSISWISTVANEVVGVLKAFGVILGISDAILGLTIFAVGNSLGDLVADITVARLGFPVMALSACFGGPMLNILLGVGISGLYMTLTTPSDRNGYEIEVSSTLMISACTLLGTLLFLLAAVPLSGWRMTKRIGVGLVAIWVCSTVVNLVVEVVGVGSE